MRMHSQSIPKRLDPKTRRFRPEIESPTSLGADQLADILRRPLMATIRQIDGLHAEDLMEPNAFD